VNSLKTSLGVIGGLILVVVVIAVFWAVGVFGTIFGAHVNAFIAKKTVNSNVIAQVFSASNKIQSQGYFEALRADFNGFLAKIKIQPDVTAYDKANLNGLRLECVDAAQQYNAAALSISQAPFRSADLPYQLDVTLC
jgi:hypothetical protein